METFLNDSLYKVNYEYKSLEIDSMNYIVTYKDTSEKEITSYVLYLGHSATYYKNDKQAMKEKYTFEQKGHTTYAINAKKYIIYSFLVDDGGDDRATRLFWCREFGFINFFNTSWHTSTSAHFFDDEKESIVNSLNFKLMSDTSFYRYNDDLPQREIAKEKLLISTTAEGYTIRIDNNNLIRIVNDTPEITQLVFNDNDAITLDFYFIEHYLSGAYLCNINNIGPVLILESYAVGASGFSANIINVSLIALDKGTSWRVLSYNSFYGGADLLKYQGEKVVLDIYDYKGFTKENNIIYCKSTFDFTGNSFIPRETATCLTYTDKGLIKNDDCYCKHLNEPYVFKAQVVDKSEP